MSIAFTVDATENAARAGRLATPHGVVETPAFMPVGTLAAVKGMTPAQLRAAGAQIVLANTYHLALRPGEARVRALGGLAAFMGWHGPTLTDSGGYQVFSLAARRRIDDDGVRFRNHINGAEFYLSPERSVQIQQDLGADLFMAFDECPPGGADRDTARRATERTHRWAKRCADAWTTRDRQALFGIVQGGVYEDMRAWSAETLAALDLPGYAIGGVAVGESRADIARIVPYTAARLPADKPRYLMGVGRPADLLMAVAGGVDMFDCVLPTRNARHAQAFTADGVLPMRNARFADDPGPLEPDCDCETCRTVSRAYVRHLLVAGESMGAVYLTLHNVRHILRLMESMRSAIKAGQFAHFAATRLARLDGDIEIPSPPNGGEG